jgi:SAM-dependent MidA family methyltransferase
VRGFDEFMQDALYGERGFYATGAGPGRRGADFITSPELGPLFGAVVANALAAWWHDLGQPDPYVVIEAGAGRGALRDAVLANTTAPLQYLTVEFADPWPDHGHVVMANELLDNLPFKIVEQTNDGWREVLVSDNGYVLGEPVRGFDPLRAQNGTRLPWHTRAVEWVERARNTAERVALVDYGTRATEELVGREWLRTYRAHGRGGDPLTDPGSQDITCDVAFDQLAPHRITTQADWLRAHGIDALVEQARATWTERAAIGDLEALKARSRVTEADALLDLDGLGSFLVAEWVP